MHVTSAVLLRRGGGGGASRGGSVGVCPPQCAEVRARGKTASGVYATVRHTQLRRKMRNRLQRID